MWKRALRILRNALNRANKLQILDSNPCKAVEMAKVRKREIWSLKLNEYEPLYSAWKITTWAMHSSLPP